MKTNLVIILVVVALLIVGCQKESDMKKITQPKTEITSGQETESTSVPETETSQPKTYNIDIKSYAFSPSELRIKKGDTIVWTNRQSISHTVTSDSGNELRSESLSNGETYSHTFNNAGIFTYHCSPHPYMKAKIIVE